MSRKLRLVAMCAYRVSNTEIHFGRLGKISSGETPGPRISRQMKAKATKFLRACGQSMGRICPFAYVKRL